jgi:hypothetical protein
VDQSVSDTNMQTFTGTLTFSREEMKTFDMEKVLAKLQALAEDLAAHQSETLFKVVGEAAQSVGNAIDGEGKPLTQDARPRQRSWLHRHAT